MFVHRRRTILAAVVAAPIALAGLPAVAGPRVVAHALPAATSSAAAPAAPEQHTDLAVPVAGATAAEAALAYARADHRGTGDLNVLSEDTDDIGSVVRLAQSVDGIPVLGGQIIVRLTGNSGSYVVRGTTDGTAAVTGSRTPTWSAAALERVVTHAAEKRFPGERVSAKAGDLVILPFGAGTLTRHVTVTLARTGGVHDVYVGARTGAVLLAVDRHKTVDVISTERNLAGQTVKVHADKAGGLFTLTDTTRKPYGPAIQAQYLTEIGEQPVEATRLPFGADDTERGTIDAHLDVAKAADYYRNVLGRNSIDGHGGDLIHVTGMNMVNAFWDGTQMVIGLGDAEYKPLSADVDVVAHEMSHGVIDHTAGFIYQSQSGALSEAYSDYFGNAVDVGQSASAMTAPRNGLIGEDLCRTLSPIKCAIRNLDDGRTVNDYTGTLADIGGVHLNATIYGGALWDIRRAMRPSLSDRVVFRGLFAYMTPWSTFTDGRDATLAAAADLGLTAAQRAAITKAFDSRGIVRGWERDGRTDADRTLLSDLPFFTDWYPPVAGGSRWALADIDMYGNWPTAFKTGRTDGTGTERVALPDGFTLGDLAVDGRYVAATGLTADEIGVWLYDTVTKKGTWLARSDASHFYVYPTVAGGRVAWQDSATVNDKPDISVYVKDLATNVVRELDKPGDVAVHFPSLSRTTLVHVQGPMTAKDLVVRDAATLKVIATKRIVTGDVDTTFIPTALTSQVVWSYVNGDREWPLGPEVTEFVSPRNLSSKRILNRLDLPTLWPANLIAQATETAFTQIRPKSLLGASPEVIQKPLAGGNAVPVTCDKGGAYLFAADQKQAVVWLSGAQGKVDLVMRSTPAGPC